MMMAHLRRTLHAELRYTQEEFEKHCRQKNCTTDTGGCLARARFQERIRTLNFALEVAGGRVRDKSIELWGPVEGA